MHVIPVLLVERALRPIMHLNFLFTFTQLHALVDTENLSLQIITVIFPNPLIHIGD